MPSGDASVLSHELDQLAHRRWNHAATPAFRTNLERDPPLHHQDAIGACQRSAWMVDVRRF